MAKSLRSKVKQRYRRAKRHFIDGTLHTDRTNEMHENVKKCQQGISIQSVRPKNAFLHPTDHEAVFPQAELRKAIDFRADALPLAGYCVTGCRRRFTEAEKLSSNLVVGCKDGALPLQMKALLEEQEKGREMNDADIRMDGTRISGRKARQSVNDDEDLLISEMKNIGLSQGEPVEFSLEPFQDNLPTLEDLKKHQEKIGGRSKKSIIVPKIQNKLKAAKQRKKV